MHAANRVAKNTLILYARMGITMFVSLYATRLVLAALGASDFGLFSVVGGAIAMLTFLNAAMTSASQRFMSYAQGEGDFSKQVKIFNVSVTMHILIGIALVGVLEIAGLFFFNGLLNIAPDRVDAAKIVYHFMVLSTFFTIISVPYDAVVNAHENMLFVAILGIVEALIKLSIALIIAYTVYDKLIIYALLMAVLSFIILIVRVIYSSRKYSEAKIIFANHIKQPLFKEMTSFAGWSFLSSSSSMFVEYGSRIILNHFFGTVLNAATGIAQQLNGQLQSFSNIMLKALNPAIVKSEGANNRQLMLKASFMGTKISFFLFAIFTIPVIIEAPYILKLWLTEVPEWTVAFLRLIIIKTLLEQLYITIGISVDSTGKIREYKIYSAVVNMLYILLIVTVFSMGFSPLWLLYFRIIIALFKGAITLYYAGLYCQIDIILYLKNIVFPLIFTFVITYFSIEFSIMFLHESFFKVIISFFISVFLYSLFTYIFTLNKAEKNLLIMFKDEIISRIIKKIYYKK